MTLRRSVLFSGERKGSARVNNCGGVRMKLGREKGQPRLEVWPKVGSVF
jgi:hypothetical protein